MRVSTFGLLGRAARPNSAAPASCPTTRYCASTPSAGIERPSAVFNTPGVHRRSPWYRAASILQLNSIEQARQKLRACSEAAWNCVLHVNRQRCPR
jgi:hypothetical protein